MWATFVVRQYDNVIAATVLQSKQVDIVATCLRTQNPDVDCVCNRIVCILDFQRTAYTYIV